MQSEHLTLPALCSTIFLGILTPPSPTLAPGIKRQDRVYMEHLEKLLTRYSLQFSLLKRLLIALC